MEVLWSNLMASCMHSSAIYPVEDKIGWQKREITHVCCDVVHCVAVNRTLVVIIQGYALTGVRCQRGLTDSRNRREMRLP